MRGLKAAEARVKAFGASMAAVGSKMVTGGVLAGMPLGLATRMTAGFEQSMARVKALTNAGADDFAAMKKEAERLGATTVYTAAQAAQTMGVFALAGMDANDVIAATGPTLNLAATGMMDLAQAADISMKVMKGMGMTTAQLPYVVDVLAKAMTTANTDLVMLGDAFKYVGPVAKAAGLSFEETTAAIQILSDAGMQGDMAGTTLRGAILSLTSPSQEAVAKMRQLGVETKDAQGNFLSLAEIVGQFEKALSGMGSGDRLEAIGTIFANRQATGIAELVDRGADALRGKTAALFDAQGTSARIAATQLDTLYGAWMLFTSAVEGVAISVGQAVTPALRDMGETLMGVTGAVRAWADANPELFATLAKVVTGVVVAGAAYLALGVAINVVMFAVGGLAAVASAAAGLVMLSFAPWVVVLSTLAKIPALIYYTSDYGAKQMKALGKATGEAMTTAGEWASAGLQKVGTAFAELGEGIVYVWNGVVEAVQAGDLELAMRIAWNGISVAWTAGVNSLTDAWDAFTDYFFSSMDPASTALAHFLNDAATELGQTPNVASGLASDLTFGLWDWAVGGSPEARQQEMIDATVARNQVAAQIDPVAEAMEKKRKADAEAARKKRQDELDKALADLEASRAAASEAKRNAEIARIQEQQMREEVNDTGPVAGGRRLPTGEEVGGAMGRASGSSSGTFSAAAIRGLTGRESRVEGLLDAIKGLSERQMRLLDKIERNTGDDLRFT